jgi:hypothetical protein
MICPHDGDNPVAWAVGTGPLDISDEKSNPVNRKMPILIVSCLMVDSANPVILLS